MWLLESFCSISKSSKAFAIVLKSFLCVFASQTLGFFAQVYCLFAFVMYLFGFQESSFSGFKDTSSQTLWRNIETV